MKAGKEAVVGAIAALRRWMALDHVARSARAVDPRADVLAQPAFADIPGVAAARVADETGNPFSRVHLTIDPEPPASAPMVSMPALSRLRPRVIVRSLLADRGLLRSTYGGLDADGPWTSSARHL